MIFCTLFLCTLRFVTASALLHLSTCFLRIVFGPSVFMQLVQRMVGIFMFLFLLMEDSLVQYRAAIGLLNCFKFVSCFIVILPPISFLVILLVLISSLSMLLLISGSVHPNLRPSSVSFLIAHLNTTSLNVSDKVGEISVLASLYGFDAFAFSEAWLNFSIANNSIVTSGFSYPMRKDRIGKRGGGVTIYPKDHIAVKRRIEFEYFAGLELL